MARQLVIMGSGEITPGMLAVHRSVFAGLPGAGRYLHLDTPFAFQENADELVERIARYFAESVGRVVERVALPAGADPLTVERAVSAVRAADWVFAGPGSPSYARRAWADTPIAEALLDVVRPGRDGALVFASAAAVTLGARMLPVYEVYKVGADPYWLPGLDVVGALLGWGCAVVPHYDNQEGGTHDTRYCWLGARRLRAIEPELGPDFILGVDEHTALVVDLDQATAWVHGRGGVTLRVAGREAVLPAGTRTTLAQVEQRVTDLGDPTTAPADSAASGPAGDRPPAADPWGGLDASGSPRELATTVLAALPDDERGARSALLALADQAEHATGFAERDLAARFVGLVVAERSVARGDRDWAASDRLRDALTELGVELRDTPQGTSWHWR